MLISLNWIKDFVEIPEMSPKELGSLFTLATAEVEDVIVKGEALKPILCVEIKSLKPHPDSQRSCLWSSQCQSWIESSLRTYRNDSTKWYDTRTKKDQGNSFRWYALFGN
jgi:hypothetical protein